MISMELTSYKTSADTEAKQGSAETLYSAALKIIAIVISILWGLKIAYNIQNGSSL